MASLRITVEQEDIDRAIAECQARNYRTASYSLATQCPIAQALWRQGWNWWEVSGDSIRVSHAVEPIWSSKPIYRYRHTHATRAAMREFDRYRRMQPHTFIVLED